MPGYCGAEYNSDCTKCAECPSKDECAVMASAVFYADCQHDDAIEKGRCE